MPAIYVWVGGFPSDPTGGGCAANWVGGPPGEIPGPGDDVYFSGNSSSVDCVLSFLSYDLHSLNLVNGYGGTVTMGGSMLNTFIQSSGTLTFTGGGLQVSEWWNWTGGSLAGGGLVNLIEGADGLIVPPEEGLTTGAGIMVGPGWYEGNESLEFREGQVTFTGGAMLSSANQVGTTVVTLLPGAILAQADATKPVDSIGIGTVRRVPTGGKPVEYKGKVWNYGKILLQNNAWADFSAGPNNYALTQDSSGDPDKPSTISMETGCVLEVAGHGFYMLGGDFVVEPGANILEDQQATLRGKFEMRGGDLKVLNTSIRYGELHCTDNVEWNGGTFHPKVGYVGASYKADRWRTSGTFTITTTPATALIDPLPQGAVGTPSTVDKWVVLEAVGEFIGTGRPSVTGLRMDIFTVVDYDQWPTKLALAGV